MIICAMSWVICLEVLAAHAVAGAPCESGSDPVREIYKIGGYKTPAIPKAISVTLLRNDAAMLILRLLFI